MLVVALVSVDFLVTDRVQQSYMVSLRRELEQKGHALALQMPQNPANFARLGQAVGARVTLVDAAGKVLGDSEADPVQMENHRGRPEIAEALAGRTGSSVRPSPTLGTSFLYVAVPCSGGALRIAVPSAQIDAQVNEIRKQVLFSTAFAFLPAALLAALFARYASSRLGTIIEYARKLAEGNFRTRLKSTGRGEFGVLAEKLNETSEKLEFMLERLESEHAELEKLETVRKDFVINVSHELRTPLASIQGYTETLLGGAIHDSANNIRFLNIIRQNTERLARLTADLLTLSRVELGQQKFKFAFYPVDRLLADNCDSMRPLAQKREIELVLEPAAANLEVFCDGESVHQILANLLDNAIKYTPDGGQVTVGVSSTTSDFVEIFVRDTGMGIPEDDLNRLFERFYRVDKARSRALGGTGLGLAIVKHLTRAQGGEVRVTSKTDVGSTFFFSLPLRDMGFSDLGALPREVAAS